MLLVKMVLKFSTKWLRQEVDSEKDVHIQAAVERIKQCEKLWRMNTVQHFLFGHTRY